MALTVIHISKLFSLWKCVFVPAKDTQEQETVPFLYVHSERSHSTNVNSLFTVFCVNKDNVYEMLH